MLDYESRRMALDFVAAATAGILSRSDNTGSMIMWVPAKAGTRGLKPAPTCEFRFVPALACAPTNNQANFHASWRSYIPVGFVKKLESISDSK